MGAGRWARMPPMQGVPTAVAIAGSYLAGAIPFAFLIARARGVDIRKVGSGNVGATNVFRAVGKGWGILTFVCDALKGLLPALLGPRLLEAWTGAPAHPAFGLACGTAAIAGHSWPVFLGFKGGKGVATSAGMMLGAAPFAAAAGVALWVVVFAVTRYVSVASIAAAFGVPLAAWMAYGREDAWRPWVLTAIGLLVIYRHRSNVQRLIDGTEHRFGRQGECRTSNTEHPTSNGGGDSPRAAAEPGTRNPEPETSGPAGSPPPT